MKILENVFVTISVEFDKLRPISHPQLICSCHYSNGNNCTQCDTSKCLQCQSLPDPYKRVRECSS